jgi:hypothetical protein
MTASRCADRSNQNIFDIAFGHEAEHHYAPRDESAGPVELQTADAEAYFPFLNVSNKTSPSIQQRRTHLKSDFQARLRYHAAKVEQHKDQTRKEILSKEMEELTTVPKINQVCALSGGWNERRITNPRRDDKISSALNLSLAASIACLRGNMKKNARSCVCAQ